MVLDIGYFIILYFLKIIMFIYLHVHVYHARRLNHHDISLQFNCNQMLHLLNIMTPQYYLAPESLSFDSAFSVRLKNSKEKALVRLGLKFAITTPGHMCRS